MIATTLPKLHIERSSADVVTITFNRPDALNALDLAMMTAFLTAIQALQTDAALRAVILTGAGERAFSSGGDLRELSTYPAAEDARRFITTMGDALLALERLPVPVIAAMNGYALGGGSEIALACDLRVVDETVKFGLVQVRMALTPGWGAGQRLLRTVGYARALDIMLHGHALTAHDLLALGLATRVAPAGQALAAAQTLAATIAALPPDVVRAMKALLQAGVNHPYEQALQMERDLFPALWAAEPHLQAVEAFLKRER